MLRPNVTVGLTPGKQHRPIFPEPGPGLDLPPKPDVGSLPMLISAYYKLVVLIVGLIGNLLVVVVMRKNVAPVTARIILVALAISDSAYLLADSPSIVTSIAYSKLFSHTSLFACRFTICLRFLFPCLSSWFTVMFTMERLIAIAMPMKVKTYMNKKTILICMPVLLSAFIPYAIWNAINSEILYLGQGPNVTPMACLPKVRSVNFLKTIVSSYVPLGLIAIFNIAICVLLIRFKRSRLDLGQKTGQPKYPSSQIVVILFAVTVTYTLLSAPLHIYFQVNENGKPADPVHLILASLYYTNFGINFYLYLVVTTTFRRAVQQIFCRCVQN